MNPIYVFVPGDPKPQPRPRAFARKMGGKFVARVYDASTAEGWKAQIAEALRPWVGRWFATGPVLVVLQFVFRRPESHYRKSGYLKDSTPRDHVGRPDLDNLAKAVLDCCTTLGLWRDDGQVCDLALSKRYQDCREDPAGVSIRLNEGPDPFHETMPDAMRPPELPDLPAEP